MRLEHTIHRSFQRSQLFTLFVLHEHYFHGNMASLISCRTLVFSLLIHFLNGLHMFPLVAGNESCKAPMIQAGLSSIRGSCSIFGAADFGIKRQVVSYSGLQYAKAPIGSRRFAPSELQDLDLEVDGTSGGPSCPQGPHPVYNTESGTNEDCLYLDVFVPLPQRDKSLAVMVWIHGGGFMYGAGTVSMLSPVPLVGLGDVIVVTINYRLGALGYLTTGDESIPPNLGILDQITALKWIKKYISAFGGDPERVTLFGDSAGSTSIHLHLMSPMSSGLFHRAIMQSGTATSSWARSPDLATARNRSLTLGRIMGCGEISSSAQLRQCLGQVPADDIVAKQQQVLIETGEPADIAFLPVVDHIAIPDAPDVIGGMGLYNNVSIIIGANADEGMMSMMQLFPEATSTPTVTHRQMREFLSTATGVHDPVLLDLIELVYGVDEHRDIFSLQKRMYSDRTVQNLSHDKGFCYNNNGDAESANGYHGHYVDQNYGVHDENDVDENQDIDEVGNAEKDAGETGCGQKLDFFDTLNDIVGDMTMFCPTVDVADFAANAGLKVYQYHMTHRPSESFWRPLTWTRVNHGENLLFVFGVHFLPHLNWTLTPEEVDMTSSVIQYWTNFVSTGDPNDNGDNLPDWPLYDSVTTGLSKNLSPAMTDDSFVKYHECRFWNSVFPLLQTRFQL